MNNRKVCPQYESIVLLYVYLLKYLVQLINCDRIRNTRCPKIINPSGEERIFPPVASINKFE